MSNNNFDPTNPGNGQQPEGWQNAQGGQPGQGAVPTNPWGQPEAAEPTQQIPSWQAPGTPQGDPAQGQGYPSQQGQGYPGQAANGQGYPSQGYPTDTSGGGYGAGTSYGTATAAPGGNGGNNKKPLIIGAGALAALLLGGGGYLALSGGEDEPVPAPVTATASPGADESASEAPSGEATDSATDQATEGSGEQTNSVGDPGQPAASAEDAVKNFIGAMQKGDSAALISTMMSEPSDTTFITDEVLKQLAAKSPITDVNTSSSGDTVRLSYSINGKKRTDTVRTFKMGDEYKVSMSIPSVSLYSLKPTDIGLKINGVEATGDSAYLLPGTYDLTTSNETFTVSEKTLVIPGFGSSPTVKAKPELAEKALTDVRSAAKAQLQTCLTTKKFVNTDCGIKFNSTGIGIGTLDEKTFSCRVKEGQNALDKVKFAPSYSDLTQVEATSLGIRLECTAKDSQGRTGTGTTSLYRVSVDTSAKPLKVVFN